MPDHSVCTYQIGDQSTRMIWHDRLEDFELEGRPIKGRFQELQLQILAFNLSKANQLI